MVLFSEFGGEVPCGRVAASLFFYFSAKLLDTTARIKSNMNISAKYFAMCFVEKTSYQHAAMPNQSQSSPKPL